MGGSTQSSGDLYGQNHVWDFARQTTMFIRIASNLYEILGVFCNGPHGNQFAGVGGHEERGESVG